MAKKLNEKEKKLFLSIGMPGIKDTASEEVKGRLFYALKKEKVSDNDLAAAFPEEYPRMLEVIKRKGFLFDKKNYVFEYFFGVHNNTYPNKVIPGQIIAFKAERTGFKNLMHAKVKYYNRVLKETSLEIFPTISIGDLNLNDHVLIHNNTICQKITDDEYKQIVNQYFR